MVFQVLDIHSAFLNTCLNDCMLSSPQLLMTVRKLLDVCSDFAETMRNFSAVCDDMDGLHDHVARYDLSFKSTLCSLLDKISRLGRENYNERILNIIHRLDFNGFYSQGLEQFGCAT
jgi:gamma-tubulin complex component 2